MFAFGLPKVAPPKVGDCWLNALAEDPNPVWPTPPKELENVAAPPKTLDAPNGEGAAIEELPPKTLPELGWLANELWPPKIEPVAVAGCCAVPPDPKMLVDPKGVVWEEPPKIFVAGAAEVNDDWENNEPPVALEAVFCPKIELWVLGGDPNAFACVVAGWGDPKIFPEGACWFVGAPNIFEDGTAAGDGAPKMFELGVVAPLKLPPNEEIVGVEAVDVAPKTDWSGFTKPENNPVGGDVGEALLVSADPSDKLPKIDGEGVDVVGVFWAPKIEVWTVVDGVGAAKEAVVCTKEVDPKAGATVLVWPKAEPKALLENNEEASDLAAEVVGIPDEAKIFADGDGETDFDTSGAQIFSPSITESTVCVDGELTDGDGVEVVLESSGLVAGVRLAKENLQEIYNQN